MAVELDHDPAVDALARRTAAFVRDVVIPVEEQHRGVTHDDAVRTALQQAAKDAGVFAPHVSPEHGGHGLDMRDRAVVFEEAGYSLLGPLALNIAAPDEGNMHMLEIVATAEQKPAPGAGSDPSALATRAERVPGGWRTDGRKWFITGADGAAFAICMTRTSGGVGDRGGATMFLVDADNPGMTMVRHIDTLDESLFGGHLEVAFVCRARRRGPRRGRRGVPLRAGAPGPGADDALHALAGDHPARAGHRGDQGHRARRRRAATSGSCRSTSGWGTSRPRSSPRRSTPGTCRG